MKGKVFFSWIAVWGVTFLVVNQAFVSNISLTCLNSQSWIR